MLKIRTRKKDFVILLLCPFCLLSSLFLNIYIVEAVCNGGAPDGNLDPGEECDVNPPGDIIADTQAVGGAMICEHLGDTSGTSGDTLKCTADCLMNDSMCSGGLQAPPKPGDVPGDFKSSILNITNWLLGFVTMIAVLVIVWGGISYLTSAGDEDKAKTGKKTLTYALLGLVVTGIAYALVNVIVETILG